jgi:hypothetical protein
MHEAGRPFSAPAMHALGRRSSPDHPAERENAQPPVHEARGSSLAARACTPLDPGDASQALGRSWRGPEPALLRKPALPARAPRRKAGASDRRLGAGRETHDRRRSPARAARCERLRRLPRHHSAGRSTPCRLRIASSYPSSHVIASCAASGSSSFHQTNHRSRPCCPRFSAFILRLFNIGQVGAFPGTAFAICVGHSRSTQRRDRHGNDPRHVAHSLRPTHLRRCFAQFAEHMAKPHFEQSQSGYAPCLPWPAPGPRRSTFVSAEPSTCRLALAPTRTTRSRSNRSQSR